MKKLIGLDYGSKNIGISVSDPFQSIAFPYKSATHENIIIELNRIIAEEEIEAIILGNPTSLKGTDTQMTNEVKTFKDHLNNKIDLPIIMQDERLISVSVNKSFDTMNINSKKRRKLKDSSEAAMILQTYLDKKNVKF